MSQTSFGDRHEVTCCMPPFVVHLSCLFVPQDASQNGLAISLELLKDQDGALLNSMKQITQMNEKFREGSLKPSIDSIQREVGNL